VHHVNELGFQGKPDQFLYKWAQENIAIVITYDEDFADSRMYPLGMHHGVIRLRVWPTTYPAHPYLQKEGQMKIAETIKSAC
jgi:predicted nuclease of predicted toxin-antitoxin system